MTSVMRPDPRYELALASQVPHIQTEQPDTSAVAVTYILPRSVNWCTSLSSRWAVAYARPITHLCFALLCFCFALSESPWTVKVGWAADDVFTDWGSTLVFFVLTISQARWYVVASRSRLCWSPTAVIRQLIRRRNMSIKSLQGRRIGGVRSPGLFTFYSDHSQR